MPSSTMTISAMAVLTGGFTLIAFLAWFFFGPKQSKRAETKAGVQEETLPMESPSVLARCDLTIKGMHCASCVSRVAKALKEVPGVQDATVNLLAERGAVKFDARQTRPEDLITAVEEAGYDASVAQR